ncbi:DUF4259 domain-containing protein [Corynebacterium guangdongense]|uniref:SpoVK/Ycf46/Vps4 family AAA+-type ATPase n=1 Tax=Corynebacterium guangdongense TaxID=1783348 RepID=A0ABU1ZUU5_9CORY|nr:DUF4259 domain-containing protein [Corynebacterium guangdongense]MDR7328694.1 SpoVK/Ycf46/Vps4 family AAA+-type ATPase [Corynebacterium guangdongense]WJZ17271.1 hypothetical protein CGUA_03375 [Corynebacterium guangdongense]
MSAWDQVIFSEDVNVDFLDELNDLDDDDIVEAVRDACLLAVRQADSASEDERRNGLAAATIAAIWAGAPFTAGDVASAYPFIRGLAGSGDEELNATAAELLEAEETDEDVDQFIEALS